MVSGASLETTKDILWLREREREERLRDRESKWKKLTRESETGRE